MIPPPVSVVCCTFGRSRQLAEAVECFLRQDYDGYLQMVILNDFSRQKLRVDASLSDRTSRRRVIIQNVEWRYGSIGEKRNAAVAMAADDLLLFVDDDDLFMPWYVREMVDTSRRLGDLPCWPNTCVKMSGVRAPLDIVIGGVGVKGSFLIDVRSFFAVGRFPAVASGEDTEIQNRIIQRWPSSDPDKYAVKHTPAYVYRWANGVHHLCAYSPMDPSIWEDAGQHAIKATDSGVEPSGDILLSPRWDYDYLSLIKEKL